MEWFSTASEWFQVNYPMLLTLAGTVSAIAGSIFVLWTKIQPILDNLKVIKNKVVDVDKEDITNQLQMLDLSTKITDLKAKINNPTISDELKQQYITQLAQLETIKAKIEAGIAKVEETTNKYT
jgi:hypothetical protein